MKREGQRTLGRSRSGRDANSREYSLRQTVMWNDSVTTNGVEMECRCNGCNGDSTRNAYLMPIPPLTLSAPQAPESNAPLVASNPPSIHFWGICSFGSGVGLTPSILVHLYSAAITESSSSKVKQCFAHIMHKHEVCCPGSLTRCHAQLCTTVLARRVSLIVVGPLHGPLP